MVLFFMKEIKGAIVSQNHRRSQGGGWPKGPRPPQPKCQQRQKFGKKALFFYFQFVLVSLRTTVINNK